MVPLPQILDSNASLSTSTLPSSPVAVFTGATSGIGASTAKAFARATGTADLKPRVYIIGRNESAAEEVVAYCKQRCPQGEWVFLKGDLSLIKGVDEVCGEIEKREERIDILFLSAGEAKMDRSLTAEGLHHLVATAFYARLRMTMNLLPLLTHDNGSFARIVTVGGGSKEGPIDTSDLPALRIPFAKLRGHLISMMTLAFEKVADDNPSVGVVHQYPGAVKTKLHRRDNSIMSWVVWVMLGIVGLLGWTVSLEESGERMLYSATSGRYPAAAEQNEGDDVARGTNGKTGSGMYSLNLDGESAGVQVEGLLEGMRGGGTKEKVWEHLMREFERIENEKTRN